MNAQTSGDWNYSVANGYAIVEGYTGNNSTVVIPEKLGGYYVEEISDSAFERATFSSITIPKRIRKIGRRAFYDCRDLSNIVYNAVGSEFSYYGQVFYMAGANTKGLTITFGEEVEKIPDALFNNTMAKVTTVNMGNGMREIGEEAFAGCKDLNKVTWSSGLETIGKKAFADCTKLQTVTIPNGVSTIGYQAFYNCRGLSNIAFNAVNCSLFTGETFYRAGADTKGLTITFGTGVKKIPDGLFRNCDIVNLTTVNMGNSIREIGSYAFDGCKELNKVTWSSSLEKIGARAFRECRKLQTVTIPSGVSAIDYEAFYNCHGLSNIVFNAVVSSCESHIGGIFYRAGADTSGMTITFGTGVKKIPAYLFNQCDTTKLTTVNISDTVQEIGVYAFPNCSSLKKVTVSAKNIAFDSYAFRGCPSSLVFECYQGSTAEVFARNNGFQVTHIRNGLYNDNGIWRYYVDGKVNTSYTGLCQYGGGWYYVQNGVVNFKATGLCQYGGQWYYVENGAVNFKATGLYQHDNAWYFVQNGAVNFKATGLWNQFGSWWYIQNGAVNFKATGLWNQFGSWWYIQNGAVSFKTTGLCQHGNAWYFVQNGAVNFKATGLWQYGGSWWYVQNGAVNFKYNGRVLYGNAYYNVVNGKVVF